ncbi:hypothetical protein [uncultured Maribacter sp.]|nr:hypothetical protein [uncultured Maribacter sp.]
METQQIRFNHLENLYNKTRPHEVLDMQTAADLHDFTTRPFVERIPNF